MILLTVEKSRYNSSAQPFGRQRRQISRKYSLPMQKHPLLSVKEAAQLLRLDERSVRERLINGQLKGEKKSVGLREKWFVYSGSIDAALEKQQGFIGDTIGLEDVTVEPEMAEDADSAEAPHYQQFANDSEEWVSLNREKVKVLAEEIVKPLMEKIESQAEVIYEQKRLISDQDRQLKLLPDLQKEAEKQRQDVELRHVENEALKKQVAALQEQLTNAKLPWWKKWFESNPSAGKDG